MSKLSGNSFCSPILVRGSILNSALLKEYPPSPSLPQEDQPNLPSVPSLDYSDMGLQISHNRILHHSKMFYTLREIKYGKNVFIFFCPTPPLAQKDCHLSILRVICNWDKNNMTKGREAWEEKKFPELENRGSVLICKVGLGLQSWNAT